MTPARKAYEKANRLTLNEYKRNWRKQLSQEKKAAYAAYQKKYHKTYPHKYQVRPSRAKPKPQPVVKPPLTPPPIDEVFIHPLLRTQK